MTFLLTEHVRRYLVAKGESFARYAEAIAALECTKLELARRRLAPYENQKLADNGDVW